MRPLVELFVEHGWSVWWDRRIPPGIHMAASGAAAKFRIRVVFFQNLVHPLLQTADLDLAAVHAGVTRIAARALGLEADRGTLEPGKRADFALWDIGHPAELSYWCGYNGCAGIVVGGSVEKSF